MAEEVKQESPPDDGLRQRHVKATKHEIHTEAAENNTRSSHDKPRIECMTTDTLLEKGSYWLTRIVILRYLGFIYCKFKKSRNHLFRELSLNFKTFIFS